MPMAMATQRVAAVVTPWTAWSEWRMMTPAPRKPMPETMAAATRAESNDPFSKAYFEIITRRHEAKQTRVVVRKPAARPCRSRS